MAIWAENQINENNIIAVNTEKVDKFFRNIEVWFPQSGNIINFDSSIAKTIKSVKYPNNPIKEAAQVMSESQPVVGIEIGE